MRKRKDFDILKKPKGYDVWKHKLEIKGSEFPQYCIGYEATKGYTGKQIEEYRNYFLSKHSNCRFDVGAMFYILDRLEVIEKNV